MKKFESLRIGLMIAIAGAVTFGAMADLRAQGPPGPPGSPAAEEDFAGPPPEEMTAEERERIEERIRVMRAWQLTEALDLDETTAIRLFEYLDAFDEQLEQEQTLMRENSRELRQLLESGEGSDERIAELVELIVSTHLRIEELKVRQVREASTILSARQQATLMLFLPQFDRRIRDMVRQVRGRGPGSDGRRPPRERRPPPSAE